MPGFLPPLVRVCGQTAGSGRLLWPGRWAGMGMGVLDCSQVVLPGPVDGVEGNVSVQRYQLRVMGQCQGQQVDAGELPVAGQVAEAHCCVVKQAYVVGDELVVGVEMAASSCWWASARGLGRG